MLHSTRFYRLFILFVSVALIFTLTGVTRPAQAQGVTITPSASVTKTPRPTFTSRPTRTITLTRTPTTTQTPTSTLTPIPTLTPTPTVQADADPLAWLDATIAPDAFPVKGALVIYFNAPMLPGSSTNPLLTWPALQGSATWNQANTILTFTPAAPLDSKKTYTFFLDPALKSAAGKTLKDAPEWTIHVVSGPQVLAVSPAAGDVLRRDPLITVNFDREMNTTATEQALTIEPAMPFEMHWKTKKNLEITLKTPLENDTRYDLTLTGLRDTDGSVLDDYRWFYAVAPFDANVRVTQPTTVIVTFSSRVTQTVGDLPFSISSALAGEWKWASSTVAIFTAKERIPASEKYTLTFTDALVDDYGIETIIPPAATFSGLSPVQMVVGSGIERSKYDPQEATLFADEDLKAFKIQFDVPVNHASAEKAFSLSPTVTGTFSWERNGGSDVLVYTFNGLLLPSKTYTIKLETTLLDAKGQPVLLEPYQQELQSSWRSAVPTFGQYGDNVQVIDADGPRKLQFGGGMDGIYFAAYRFDLIDFAKLYAEYYQSRPLNGNDIPLPAGMQPTLRWTEFSREETQYKDEFTEQTTLPAALAPGLYILNLGFKDTLYDQLFLVVTRNTLMVKNDGQNLLVWLTNIHGESVANAEIRVYSETGEKIREGVTDADGQYRVSIPPGAAPMLVSARTQEKDVPEDVSLVGFASWGSSRYYYNNDVYYPDGQSYLVYAYTERPIYRPGQTVNFKALVRKDNDMRYEVPNVDTPVKVRVLDARSNAIESFELRTNRFGTVNGSVVIAEGAMLGNYEIETEVEGVITSQYFEVEDYRKPDYQIKLTSLQPEKENNFVDAEEVKVQVNVSYYFGEPLANTALTVKFYRRWEVSVAISETLMTDAKGNATITFKAPYDTSNNNYYYDGYDIQSVRMQVTADDGSNQPVTGLYYFQVHKSAVQMKLDTGGYYFAPDQAFTVTALTTDIFDQPLENQDMELTVHAWQWSSYEFISSADQTYALKTNAQGSATQEIRVQKTGYYELKLSGKDAAGHKTEAMQWIYVFKDGMGWFQRSRDNQLSISADKSSYKPYQKARFAIESTFSGPALLSFERGSVINTKMVQLTAPLTIIETDVIPEHAPNVYVTVNAWQAASKERHQRGYYTYTESDSYLRMAATEILVDASTKALDITITTDKQTYAPGEKVSAVVQVKDADGKPVAAELSLAVVDEAIFALAGDGSGEIFDAFYGPRGHSVYTYDSMAPYRIIFEQGGGRGGGADPDVPTPRSDFPDTSAWLPVIETDANGQATIPFDLPDNTTSWRLTVKAITLNHKVGQAQTNIETKKDVFVNPSLPRVLTSGDQATLTARVHNYGAVAQTVTVNLTAAGLDLQGPNEQQITLNPGDVQTVGWRVTVSGAKPTDVTISVKGAGGPLDAIRLPLMLQPAAVNDVQNQSGQFTGSLTLGLPLPRVERETSLVQLTLNRSMSGTILNGLEYLTGYPYGCVEQTMSRALPNAVVGRAASLLGVGGPALQEKLNPLIKAGIQKLYGLQHSDGGWGWWVDDESDAYETAWVLFGLGLMNDSGYPIEPQVMDDAVRWLTYETNHEEVDIRTRAYAYYSMAEAGRGDKGKTLALVTSSIKQLDPFSQAALALALEKLGEKEQAQAVLALLTKSALKKGDQVYWPQPSYDGEYHRKTMASTIRTTALVLLAYTRIEPKNTLIPGIVTYLAGQRQGIRGWGTTNETSFTILALTEYFKAQQAEQGSAPYEVFANGKRLFQGTLEVGQPRVALEIPLTELNDGLNSLLVTTQGDQPLYYDLSTRYDLLQTNPQAAGKIKVTRSYLDPKTGQSVTELQAGQVVKVVLDVNLPETASFLAVEDYLPGGLEALNEGLNAISEVNYDPNWGGENYLRYYWKEYGYNYKEIRGDRVVFFITTFEKGSRKFTYFARATTPGEFVALPTQVYAMYDQSMWGRTAGSKILIK